MSILSSRNVLVGVTAGIAAYKIAHLIRLLVKAGANVKVIMTPAAKDFVTPLTLSTLSKNPVHSTFFDKEDENELWNNHVDLGLWADLFIIAPATANTLSKMAHGTCDNLLLATYLSAKCKVYFAPAMDLDMYKHQSTVETFEKLQNFGNMMIPAESGELASGLVGMGRMAEPETILSFIEKELLSGLPLNGKKVLITAGPTYEAIDPVRFIGNHSSGKMGFELAKCASNLGAEVLLITGSSSQVVNDSRIKRIDVISAQEMYDRVHEYYEKVDIAIASAAVADYRPVAIADQKIKKKGETMSIDMVKTQDILASMGSNKTNQFLVGFALETTNEIANAKDKLKRKNLDMIVLNSLQDKGAGFKKDTNKITIIGSDEKQIEFPLKSKKEVASDIFNEILIRTHA